MRSYIYIIIFSLCSLGACTSTAVQGVSDQQEETQLPADEQVSSTPIAPPSPPPPVPDNKYGVDSMQTLTNYSLYRGYYKYGEFEEGIPYWRYVFNNAPKVRKQLYKDGEKMYQDFINGSRIGAQCKDGSTTDQKHKDACKENGGFDQWNYENIPSEVQKQAYFDTLMMVYNQRIKYFGEEGKVTALKARSMAQFYPDATQEIMQLRAKTVSIDGEDTPFDILQYYALDIAKEFNDKRIDEGKATDILTQLSEIAAHNVQQDNKAEQYGQVGNVIDNLIDKIAGVSATSCEEIVSYYEPKYRVNPDDLNQTTTIYKKLRRSKCSKEPFFFEVLLKMNELEPTSLRHRIIAQLYARDSKLEKAKEHYKISISLEADQSKNAETHLKIAQIYSMQNQFSDARTEAYKAAKLNPGLAEPYILIGDLYLSSGGSCKKDGISGKSRQWVAADKYKQALDIDPYSREAKRKLSSAKRGFPEQTVVFMSDIELNSTYTVPCWINETTKVRVK